MNSGNASDNGTTTFVRDSVFHHNSARERKKWKHWILFVVILRAMPVHGNTLPQKWWITTEELLRTNCNQNLQRGLNTLCVFSFQLFDVEVVKSELKS